MRKKIIAGNWKMNMTASQAKELIGLLKDGCNTDLADVVFCPPYVDLALAIELTKDSNIAIGAQNMHFEESGAFTGEISPSMLSEIGTKYVILGHSERREYFNETDISINKKVKKAFEHGLIPIICCGETLIQREQGIEIDFIRQQIKIALLDIPAEQVKDLIIAYEPIWAIGTGKVATSAQAQAVCRAIRQVVGELYPSKIADAVRIQYGGSVNAKNANELFSQPDIDGALVGGAALKADFIEIIKAAN